MAAAARQKRLVWSLAAVAAGMFAFGFALVPLYDVLCQALGINGKVSLSSAAPATTPAAADREITVQLLVNRAEGPGWAVEAPVEDLRVRPAETRTLAFLAHNHSDRAITLRAVANVTPPEGAAHLKKTECFCFQEQSLAPGESVTLPLVFFVDEALPRTIDTLSLSYTLYEVTRLAAAE